MTKPHVRIGSYDEYDNPFLLPLGDVSKIESILWKNAPFCFQVYTPSRLRYSLLGNAPTNESSKKYILFDRNVAMDIGNLFQPKDSDQSPRDVTAAIILFLRLCKFTPLALPALQEFESLNQGRAAYDEAVSFCKALGCSIPSYLSILNGRASRLVETDVSSTLHFPPHDPSASDFTLPHAWVLSYTAILKMVTLKRDETLSPLKRMEAFLEWVHNNFFFTPPLFLVASQFLSSTGKKSIIKRAMTEDMALR